MRTQGEYGARRIVSSGVSDGNLANPAYCFLPMTTNSRCEWLSALRYTCTFQYGTVVLCVTRR
jgi:hypothetical protein